jgi:hypothetical protein
MLRYDMPGTGATSASCYTNSQERLINKAERRLTNLKYRLELNEERCFKVDDMGNYSPKSQKVWNAISDYCEVLENHIEELDRAISNDDYEKINDLLFWGLEYDKI